MTVEPVGLGSQPSSCESCHKRVATVVMIDPVDNETFMICGSCVAP